MSNLEDIESKSLTCNGAGTNVPECFSTYSADNRKAAFTLAEVLITLGIIGIVAALTLPALIQKNNNRVVETRLQKFYSAINQAVKMAEVDYGDKIYWYEDLEGAEFDKDGNPVPGSSEAEKWFNKYLTPYMKILKTQTLSDGTFIVYFPDNSALATSTSAFSRGYYFYPSNPEKCIAKSDTEATGICRFTFNFKPIGGGDAWKYHHGKGFEPSKYRWDGTIDMLYEGCKGQVVDSKLHGYCTTLIQMNNWKIPDDYPFKVSY